MSVADENLGRGRSNIRILVDIRVFKVIRRRNRETTAHEKKMREGDFVLKSKGRRVTVIDQGEKKTEG
jgi:hypothetical protein